MRHTHPFIVWAVSAAIVVTGCGAESTPEALASDESTAAETAPVSTSASTSSTAVTEQPEEPEGVDTTSTEVADTTPTDDEVDAAAETGSGTAETGAGAMDEYCALADESWLVREWTYGALLEIAAEIDEFEAVAPPDLVPEFAAIGAAYDEVIAEYEGADPSDEIAVESADGLMPVLEESMPRIFELTQVYCPEP